MLDVYDLDREQFITELEARTEPEFVYHNAHLVYELLADVFEQPCNDSLLREWAFQWTSEKLNIDYDLIYKRWLA